MRKLLFISAILTAGAIMALAEVSTDYSHSTDFGRYHTYSWIKVQASNSLWQDRISRDVDSELSAKGWTRVASGGDAAVSAFGATQYQPTLNTFYDGLGGGWFWRGGFGDGFATTTMETQPIGTLTVDIFDAGTKKLIWRATGTKALSTKAEKNEGKLEDTIAGMFKHFPPPSKG